jgi:trk system potassium uptake protein TrkH
MGIVVFTVAVFPLLGIGGMQLMQAEAPGPTVDKITPKITETAKILWIIYGGMTVVETALLMIGGMDLYDALTHTIGTLATGGFSPKNASVGHFDSAFVDGVITVFMLAAGVNFILYFRMLTGRFTYVRKNTEVRAYLGIYVAATVIATIGLFRHQYPTIGESLRYAAFQTASILTTTGYATTDFEAWPAVAQAVLFLLMFVGGSTGSTGGGMKVLRIVTAIKQGINEMRYLIYPRGVFGIKINGTNVRKDVVYAITGFIFLYVTALLLVTLIVATAGNSVLTSLSTALVTVGNIGPGFGEVGPTENYAFFPPHIKWVLSFAMMLGRLELYTVLVLFTPGFWRR